MGRSIRCHPQVRDGLPTFESSKVEPVHVIGAEVAAEGVRNERMQLSVIGIHIEAQPEYRFQLFYSCRLTVSDCCQRAGCFA